MTNGGTGPYHSNLLFINSGRGPHPPTIALVNPSPPHNATILLDNYYGRQFNSLNDIKVHPSGSIFFTDVLYVVINHSFHSKRSHANSYGHLFNFRPAPRLPNHVYRFDPRTGAVRVVAADFDKPNGIAFSQDGKKAYMSVLILISVFMLANDLNQCRYRCGLGIAQAGGPNGTCYYVSRIAYV